MRLGPILREAAGLLWTRKSLVCIPLISAVPTLAVIPLFVAFPSLAPPWSPWSTIILLAPTAIFGGISETLLVTAVRRARAGHTKPRLLDALRSRWKGASAVVLAGSIVGAVTALATDVPGWLLDLGVGLPVVIASVALLALPYAALEVTLSAWLELSVRHAVLEDAGPLVSLIRAWRFLRGRLSLALKLYFATTLVTLAMMVILMLPPLVGQLLIITTGSITPMWIALAVIAAVMVPAICVAEAYCSTVWTLSFLDERAIH